MKKIKRIGQHEGKPFPLFVISILILLIIGIGISMVQLRQQQTANSSAFFATATPTPQPHCSVSSSQLAISQQEQKLFDQINAYRINNKLSPLAWSPVLILAASWMSNDMLIHNNLSHIDSLGRDPATRIERCGYSFPAATAENIDSGSTDAATILSAWEHSPMQNANILSAQFTQIGIALETGSSTAAYWTVDFATSPSPTPVITHSISPTFSLTAAPTTPKGSISPTPIHTPTPTYHFLPTGTPLPTRRFMPTNTPLPTPIPSPTTPPGFFLNPFDTQVFVSIKIPGVGADGNKSPRHLTRHVQVNIFDLTNQPVLSGYGFLVFDRNLFRGIIHLGKIPDDTYYIKIIGDNTLEVLDVPQFQMLSSKRLNILPQVTLVQGDINGDNVLDLNDYNLALACFQDKKCQTAGLIDFNDDGNSDVIDYNLLLQNFQRFEGD